jgi:hypothetical protein
MNELIPGDPAKTRYAALLAVVGQIHLPAYERGLLVHIASWLSESEVNGLCRVIERAKDLGEIRDLLALATLSDATRDDQDRYHVVLGPTLVRHLLDQIPPEGSTD